MLKDIIIEISQSPKAATAIGTYSIGSATVAEWWGIISSAGQTLMIIIGAAAPLVVILTNFISARHKAKEVVAALKLNEKEIEEKNTNIQKLNLEIQILKKRLGN